MLVVRLRAARTYLRDQRQSQERRESPGPCLQESLSC